MNIVLLKEWSALPKHLKIAEVRPYYEHLQKHKASLVLTRIFDIILAAVLLVVLSPLLIIVSAWVKLSEPREKVFYLQTRVTQYGKHFLIYKFRTMHTVTDGAQITTLGDVRITKAGKILRKYRLDELPQLFNILKGDMAFVGTRPEVLRYVACYRGEMLATLLLPAGVTSTASIAYKDEAKILSCAVSADDIYVKEVLPAKMLYNLDDIRKYGIWHNIKIILKTLSSVLAS